MPYQFVHVICIVTLTALSVAVPMVLRWLIDDILPHRRWGMLATAAGLVLALHVAGIVVSATGALVNAAGMQRMNWGVRRKLVRHVQTLPPRFHADHGVGDLMQRLERDVAVVGELGVVILPSIMRVCSQATMTVAAMAFLDWRLACAVTPLLPLFALVHHRYRNVLRGAAEQVREASGQQSSYLSELLAGATQIQLLGSEGGFLRRYTRFGLLTMRCQMIQRRSEQLFTGLEMGVVGLGMALVLGYGGWQVMAGALSAGSLVAFYAYIGRVFSPMETAVELFARMHRVEASVRRLIELEKAPNVVADLRRAKPLTERPVTISFNAVTFRYEEGRDALHNVSFEVRAGERVAVLGPSGSGKSSLLKLIPRLYVASRGVVYLNGMDIRELQLRSVRRSVSLIPQEAILFQGTVMENLRYGAPGASTEEIEEAAWVACLDDVVKRLPHGWETGLGASGCKLSGGERQRLAVARAVLQRRSVLLLDEATSALDAATERTILSRLDSFVRGRIVISVAHRASIAEWSDRLLMVTNGAVADVSSARSDLGRVDWFAAVTGSDVRRIEPPRHVAARHG